ncbi:MAG: restriction endonuclease subunit S [Deltaproteobacteria bacterium]|nr:restriction endonuclease subunit S [Deltaproteobacteria bacterium]MDZ4341343.1 restriction endonuclease subunit S [Candidatus Binatia bacterium]
MEAAKISQQDSGEKLPSGWRWVRLREVISEAQGGFASGERDLNGIIQLRMNNVTNRGKFDWSSFLRVPADSAAIAAYRLEVGDVLFNNTNSTDLVGKTALFKGYREPVVFSNHFTRLRAITDLLSPDFLSLWLQTQWQQRVFANICNRWIGQSAVQRDKLLALEIPLPPLSEQKRIAAILNEQMAEVERARVAAEAQLAAAKSLPAAYLRAVFNSAEAQDWGRKPLGDVCELLPAKSIASDGDTKVLAITTACLTEAGFQPSGVKTARMRARDAAECVVSPGEVLIARSNTPELVGRVAMFGGDPSGAVASDLTIRLRTKDGVVAAYLAAYLSSLYTTGYWKERAGGASGTMKKITRSQIQNEQVPIPSEAEQHRITATLSDQVAAAEKTRKALEDQLATINKLPAALLRRAFSGEL